MTSITFSSAVSVKFLGENYFVEEYGDYWRLNMRLVDEKQLFPKLYSLKVDEKLGDN